MEGCEFLSPESASVCFILCHLSQSLERTDGCRCPWVYGMGTTLVHLCCYNNLPQIVVIFK